MEEFFKRVYFQNTALDYLTALLIFVLCIVGIYIVKSLIMHALKKWSGKTGRHVDQLFIKGIQRLVIPFLYLGSFYLAFKSLTLSPKVIKATDTIYSLFITFIIIRIIISFLNYFLTTYFKRQEHGIEKEKQLKGISTLISILVWGLGVVFLLDNLGFKVSTVITGLGIGGVAVALAAQTILRDLFSYFIIFFDRPFEIGDFITVGDKAGSVEYIGIKTTRLRALGGEQLVFSNADLTDSRIHNFKKMEKRRVVFQIGVVYQTAKQQLEEIPTIIKNIIVNQKDVTFDRSHLSTFGDSSINFENVYYVNSSDYTKYMDIQQAINLKIFEEFEKRGIGFAYPTQTIFVAKDESQ